jgi:hypothetical protein
MSAQAQRIAAVLASKDSAGIAGWLARLAASLDGEPTLDRETISDLVSRGRPRWGVRSSEDAAAYLAFWADLVRRHPDPRIAAAYSDVLHLLGGHERACEALRVFLDAARRDPSVFIEYSGDFSEIPPQCGPAAELDFELATVAYYAHCVDEGEMDAAELQESVHELLARHGDDPAVRARLFEIARGVTGAITR